MMDIETVFEDIGLHKLSELQVKSQRLIEENPHLTTEQKVII